MSRLRTQTRGDGELAQDSPGWAERGADRDNKNDFDVLCRAWLRAAGRAASQKNKPEMDHFDKRMALDVIEDALTTMGPPESSGFVIGLCGGFYLSGLLSKDEWEGVLERVSEKTKAAPASFGVPPLAR